MAEKRTSMRDVLGRETRVDDYIFYSTTGRYAESRVCRAVRFTAKTMFVDVLHTNRPSYSQDKNVAVQNEFVRIELTDGELARCKYA